MNTGYNQSEFQFDGSNDIFIVQDPIIETAGNVPWSESDIQILKAFCRKHRIPRFHCGHMSPIAALAYLKNQMGIPDGPMEGSNPYQSAMNKKSVLHG